jgi:hypothetical protein
MLIHITSCASALIGSKILRVAENRPVHGDAAVECYDTSALPCHETAMSDVYVIVWVLAYIARRDEVLVIRYAGRYRSVGFLVGGSRTCCTISMEILLIYILKDWKEDLSSYGKGQLSMKTL